jgi:hypothetical protein
MGTRVLLSAFMLTLACWLGTVPAQAEASPATCVGTYAGVTFPGPLVVPSGTSCLLSNSTVIGNVVVSPGGLLQVFGSQIRGGLFGRASAVQLHNSRIAGRVTLLAPVDVPAPGGGHYFAVVFCDDAIGGSVTITGASGPDVSIILGFANLGCNGTNVIGGALVDTNNRTTAFHVLEHNAVGGSLVCSGNAPPPSGGGNVAAGSKFGQCRSL